MLVKFNCLLQFTKAAPGKVLCGFLMPKNLATYRHRRRRSLPGCRPPRRDLHGNRCACDAHCKYSVAAGALKIGNGNWPISCMAHPFAQSIKTKPKTQIDILKTFASRKSHTIWALRNIKGNFPTVNIYIDPHAFRICYIYTRPSICILNCLLCG